MPGNARGHLLGEQAASNTTSPATGFAVDSKPYQLLPPLTAEELAALRDDIAANGVLVPITVDQHGVIIDGHHRQHIAAELGIPCPKVLREFTSDEERREFALGLNLKRRHLTREQMRQLIATECERTPDASDREIARRLGCSHRTVAAVRRPVSNLDTPEVDNLSTPRVTREEAEALTEAIRREIDRMDQAGIDLLRLGVPPAEVATAVMQAWAPASDHVNDAEFNDAIWRHIVSPRVAAILRSSA
jgi:ParB-like chromosome segregation protein Spo0J